MCGGGAVRALFTFRALVTMLLGGAYIGALIWSLLHDRLDVQSFIAGLGPSFGVALAYWFRDAGSGATGGTP